MEKIDIEDYFQSMKKEFGPLEGTFVLVFRKQARDMSIGKTASPKEVDELIMRTVSAMEFFAGPKMKIVIGRKMRSELKKRAPGYFEKIYSI